MQKEPLEGLLDLVSIWGFGQFIPPANAIQKVKDELAKTDEPIRQEELRLVLRDLERKEKP